MAQLDLTGILQKSPCLNLCENLEGIFSELNFGLFFTMFLNFVTNEKQKPATT